MFVWLDWLSCDYDILSIPDDALLLKPRCCMLMLVTVFLPAHLRSAGCVLMKFLSLWFTTSNPLSSVHQILTHRSGWRPFAADRGYLMNLPSALWIIRSAHSSMNSATIYRQHFFNSFEVTLVLYNEQREVGTAAPLFTRGLLHLVHPPRSLFYVLNLTIHLYMIGVPFNILIQLCLAARTYICAQQVERA